MHIGHVIGERQKITIYGECYLSAIMHKKSEFGLNKLKKSESSPCKNGPEGGN